MAGGRTDSDGGGAPTDDKAAARLREKLVVLMGELAGTIPAKLLSLYSASGRLHPGALPGTGRNP